MTSRSTSPPSLPVRPRTHDLPLLNDEFDWECFERFCVELVRQTRGVVEHSVHRYGVQGDDQRGVDIVAKMLDGTTRVFQCRRVKDFGPAAAQAVIDECGYEADCHVICVGRRVTAPTRNVVSTRDDWDIWDAEDLTDRLRELPIAYGTRIISRFFGPHWSEAILGAGPVRTFVPADLYFKRSLAQDQLFNHAWPFAGREEELAQLLEFVRKETSAVALVHGPGTIGKSKLLYELTRRNDDDDGAPIYFLADGISVSPEAINDLHPGPCTIVVDDAHRRDDLDTVLSVIAQRHDPTKLLLSTRPQGVPEVSAVLSRLGFAAATPSLALERLPRPNVDELARGSLGADLAPAHAERLASITRDSPLVTLVGGRLLRTNQVDPALLERDDEFRHTVLGRFRDEMLGRIAPDVDQSLARQALEAIAAISPLSRNTHGQLAALAEHLSLETGELERLLDQLVGAGLLLHVGRRYRIIPDVLSDHLLANIVRGADGRATGMERTYLDEFASACLCNLLKNFAEVDWRCRAHADDSNSPLLQHLWDEIVAEFDASDTSARFAILVNLEGVGFFQPELVLRIGRIVAAMPDDESSAGRWSISPRRVRQRFGQLLRPAGYHLAHLPAVLDLLWELGRDDQRDTNPNPEHATRLLCDLAGFEEDKPLAYNTAAVDAAERWLSAPDVGRHHNSPLDVVDVLLVRNSFSSRSSGHQWQLRPYTINMDVVGPVRRRVLGLLRHAFEKADLRLALRAAKSVESALREPMPIFNQMFDEEDRARWEPSQLEILDVVDAVVATAPHPLVRERLIDALSWHVKRSSYAQVRRRSADIVNTLRTTDRSLLLRVLRDSWHLDELPDLDEDEDATSGIRRHEERLDEEVADVVDEFVAQHEFPRDGAIALSGHFEELSSVGEPLQPFRFMGLLRARHSAYASEIGRAILNEPRDFRGLRPFCHCFIGEFHDHAAADFQAAADAYLGANDPDQEIIRALAAAMNLQGWLRRDNPTEFDRKLVRRLSVNVDVEVKVHCIQALAALGQLAPKEAVDGLLTVTMDGHDVLARHWCQAFAGRHGISLDELSDEDCRWLLGQLMSINNLAEHWTRELFERIAARLPHDAAKFLIERACEDDAEAGYRALPSVGTRDHIGGFSDEALPEALTAIREASLRGGWRPHLWMPRLFAGVARGRLNLALPVLDEWVASGDREQIKAATHLASGFSTGFATRNVDFVSRCLESAAVHGRECSDAVAQSLQSTELTGMRSGTAGQPFPEDVHLRESCEQLLETLEVGSRAHDFYMGLRARAVGNLEEHEAREVEFLDDQGQ